MTNNQRIDSLIARYHALAQGQKQLGALRDQLVRLARDQGYRRDGNLLLRGSANLALILREPECWIPRHHRRAHWKIAKTEVAGGK